MVIYREDFFERCYTCPNCYGTTGGRLCCGMVDVVDVEISDVYDCPLGRELPDLGDDEKE